MKTAKEIAHALMEVWKAEANKENVIRLLGAYSDQQLEDVLAVLKLLGEPPGASRRLEGSDR